MNLSFSTLVIIVALVVFALAAYGWTYRKTDLIAVGLALWSLTEVASRLHAITLSTLVLLLAFIAFVAAAIGWRYRKINLIAVGLALWMLSIIVP